MAAITVLMPVYNNAAFVAEAIRSVMSQTYMDWKLVVLNDASTDGTAAIARSLSAEDARIQVFSNARNLGPSGNLNKAMELVETPFVTKLDGDDLADPEWLARCHAQLAAHPEQAAVFVRFQKMDAHGNMLESSPYPEGVLGKVFSPATWVQQGLDSWNGSFFYPPYSRWFQGYGLWRTELLKAHLPFQPWPNEYDMEMWFRIGAKHSFFALDEPLYLYRQHPGAVTGQVAAAGHTLHYKYLLNCHVLDLYLQQDLITANHHRKQMRALKREHAGHKAYVARKGGQYVKAIGYYARKFCVSLLKK